MTAWHETDAFWEDFREVMFHERRWAQADAEAEDVARLIGLLEGSEVLDACCGPGRHAIALAKRGFRVTGVDRTASYVDTARERAAEAGVESTFIVDDVRTYRDAGRFDAAICLYTSFGYFEEAGDDVAMLANLRASVKPGGALTVDVNGKEVVARAFRPRAWERLDGGAMLIEERTVGPDWAWIDNRWILVDGDERKEAVYRVRMYSGVEMRNAMLEAGFQAVALYGDWNGEPYDAQARRLIAVGRN